MAELGEVTRFARRSTVTAFADVDPGANQSGAYEAKRSRISKRGSPELHRTLFLVMDCLLKNRPQDNPVYRFMDRKLSEGKLYLVYMTADANRFLRIYYGKVLEQSPAADTDQNIRLVLHIFLDRRFDAGTFVMLFFIVLKFFDFFLFSYYGNEADQYSFYCVPKTLLTLAIKACLSKQKFSMACCWIA